MEIVLILAIFSVTKIERGDAVPLPLDHKSKRSTIIAEEETLLFDNGEELETETTPELEQPRGRRCRRTPPARGIDDNQACGEKSDKAEAVERLSVFSSGKLRVIGTGFLGDTTKRKLDRTYPKPPWTLITGVCKSLEMFHDHAFTESGLEDAVNLNFGDLYGSRPFTLHGTVFDFLERYGKDDVAEFWVTVLLRGKSRREIQASARRNR